MVGILTCKLEAHMQFSACGLNHVSGSYKWHTLGNLQGALEWPKPCIINHVHPNDAIQLIVHVSVTSVCRDPIKFHDGTNRDVNLKCKGNWCTEKDLLVPYPEFHWWGEGEIGVKGEKEKGRGCEDRIETESIG